MHRPSASWLVALAAMLSFGLAGHAAAEPIRVLTFNLLHGGPVASVTGDGERLEDRLTIVVAELRRLQPDVIALQEASIGARGVATWRCGSRASSATTPRTRPRRSGSSSTCS